MSSPKHFRSAPRLSVLVGAAALFGLLGPSLSTAADPPVVNEKFSDLSPAIKMLRSEVGKDRREIVKENMLLTESEGKTFWPLYDQYRKDMHEQGDRRVRLITDFAANRSSMSEEEAARLTKEALSIEEDKISLKQDYVKKMSKVLRSEEHTSELQSLV